MASLIEKDQPFYCEDGPLMVLTEDGTGERAFLVIGFAPAKGWTDLDAYFSALRRPFTKLCRLRFLNPDGSTAFAVDNSPERRRNFSFISGGTITANLQNGQRREATVTFDNTELDFDYNVNHLWFGQQIAIDEGLRLPDGTDYYIQQGIFLISDISETVAPSGRTISYNLIDKWANLDGTLFGTLANTYNKASGQNIFSSIADILETDKGNGMPIDGTTPVMTEYYNGRTDEGGHNMAQTTYAVTIERGNSYADAILELAGMVNAWVGYDSSGALRIEPSQDDITDSSKPVLWQFSQEEAELCSMQYSAEPSAVYNDVIVVGESLSNGAQASGRATNYDPRSDTNANLIGLKTAVISENGLTSDTQCRDKAALLLKKSSALSKTVQVSCSQIFHLRENDLITIVRTDREGSPVERHLIQGWSRPLASAGAMTISCVSVNDIPIVATT